MSVLCAFPDFFRLSNIETIHPNFYLEYVHGHFDFSESENANIYCWDRVVRRSLEVFETVKKLGIEISRSTSDATRPDFMCWMYGVLLLKGEEEGTKAGFDNAKYALLN